METNCCPRFGHHERGFDAFAVDKTQVSDRSKSWLESVAKYTQVNGGQLVRVW
jgi:hypothetical protein